MIKSPESIVKSPDHSVESIVKLPDPPVVTSDGILAAKIGPPYDQTASNSECVVRKHSPILLTLQSQESASALTVTQMTSNATKNKCRLFLLYVIQDASQWTCALGQERST